MALLRALKSKKIGGKNVKAGEEFSISEPQAKIMIALRWAERATVKAKRGRPKAAVAPPAPPAPVEPPKAVVVPAPSVEPPAPPAAAEPKGVVLPGFEDPVEEAGTEAPTRRRGRPRKDTSEAAAFVGETEPVMSTQSLAHLRSDTGAEDKVS